MTEKVKLLGVEIDCKLKFEGHVKIVGFTVNQNISALTRLNKNISRDQARTVFNSVVLSKFNYCPLIWMFCGKTANDEINCTHKRALRVL